MWTVKAKIQKMLPYSWNYLMKFCAKSQRILLSFGHHEVIMLDENGENKNTIRQVLGDEMAKRSWECQWHYFWCSKCQSRKIKASDRKEFLNLAYVLAKDAVTKNEYFDLLTKLKEMCTTNLCMKWLKFRHERCEHFIPAYCAFFLPSMNIAESG